MKLTKKKVDLLSLNDVTNCSGIVWDDILKGFGVRLNPGGTKSYIVSYRLYGVKKLSVISRTNKMTLKDAKRMAIAMLDIVIMNNIRRKLERTLEK